MKRFSTHQSNGGTPCFKTDIRQYFEHRISISRNSAYLCRKKDMCIYMYIYMCVYICVCTIHMYMSIIYGPGRRPGNPPPNAIPPPQKPPLGGGLTIYDHPSRSHMPYTYTLTRATYTLPNRIPPCSVHYCLYAHTIYLQPITVHKVKI